MSNWYIFLIHLSYSNHAERGFCPSVASLSFKFRLYDHCCRRTSRTKKYHILPMAHHSKFAAKGTAKSTLANYGKLSHAKHCGKKRSPASHKRMAKNSIFTFPSVKACHGLPRFSSLQINKSKMANLPLFAKNSCFLDIGKTAVNRGLTVLYLFERKR